MNKTISTSQYRLRDLESKFKQAVQTNTHRLCCVQEYYLHLKVCKMKVHRIAVFPQCALSCLSIREAAGLSPSLDRKTLPPVRWLLQISRVFSVRYASLALSMCSDHSEICSEFSSPWLLLCSWKISFRKDAFLML